MYVCTSLKDCMASSADIFPDCTFIIEYLFFSPHQTCGYRLRERESEGEGGERVKERGERGRERERVINRKQKNPECCIHLEKTIVEWPCW